MLDELTLRLLATPTLQLPNIGLGDLSSRTDARRAELRMLSSLARRREWTRAGHAMRDGSFPVPNVPHLRLALQAYGHAADKPKTKRWLIRRSRALDRTDLLPESWGVAPREHSSRTAAAQTHSGIMVTIYPPADVAEALAGAQDGDEPPEEMHVTLAYLGDSGEFQPEQIEAMKRAVSNAATATSPEQVTQAQVQGVGSFVSLEGDDPRWYSVDCVGLAALRTMVVTSLEAEGVEPRVEHDFTPHMTVRYGGEMVTEIPDGGAAPWPVTEIVLVVAGERFPAAIGQPNPEEATGFEDDGVFAENKQRLSVLDLEEGRPMSVTQIAASAAAGWTDEYAYFWDPDTDDTFRVKDDIVESFMRGVAEAVEDDAETPAAWEVRTDMTMSDVEAFPTVDDAETLEAIVGAALTKDDTKAVDVLPEGAGRQFEIAVVIPEGVPSGDRRSFAKDALEFLDPPFPLFWQKTSDEGHKSSVAVGKFTHIERTEAGLGNARGVFDTHEDAVEAARQVEGEFLLGVSGDVDQFKAELSTDDEGEENIHIQHGRLVGATLVGKPAFQECRIKILPVDGAQPDVVTASGGPLNPPAAWFVNPNFERPTRLTVDDDGKVFGHIAAWGTPHLGNPTIKPPRSRTNYREYNSRPLRAAEGIDVKVGQLTLVGGHAELDLDAKGAIAHYDDTRSAVADVVAGEDDHGIWVAGAMRPNVTAEQLRAFRASDPSGDWRVVDGHLELVAVCQVNTPGFPVARSLVASGEPLALVAAGAATLRRGEDPLSLKSQIASLETRLAVIEDERAAQRRAEAAEVIQALRS